MRLLMLKTCDGSVNGRDSQTYVKDEEYNLPDTPGGLDLARVFIQEGWAFEIPGNMATAMPLELARYQEEEAVDFAGGRIAEILQRLADPDLSETDRRDFNLELAYLHKSVHGYLNPNEPYEEYAKLRVGTIEAALNGDYGPISQDRIDQLKSELQVLSITMVESADEAANTKTNEKTLEEQVKDAEPENPPSSDTQKDPEASETVTEGHESQEDAVKEPEKTETVADVPAEKAAEPVKNKAKTTAKNKGADSA